MLLEFTKMHGIGNDYIYFDCLKQGSEKLLEEIIRATPLLSDRHFGIGGDGTVLILSSEVADAHMRMFNADGSEGKMCGNAIRCVAKYLFDKGIIRSKTITIETASGIKKLEIETKDGKVDSITVDMGSPDFKCKNVPCLFSGDTLKETSVFADGKEYVVTAVSVGNPHAVIFNDEMPQSDLRPLAEPLQKSEIFPEGVNVEFIKVKSRVEAEMRVYERGSGETLACGTGACAAVAAGVETGRFEKGTFIKVCLRGGTLFVKYDGKNLFMKGGATKVFEGRIDTEDFQK